MEVLHVQKEQGGYFGVSIELPNGLLVKPVTQEYLVAYIPGKQVMPYNTNYINLIDSYYTCTLLHLQPG